MYYYKDGTKNGLLPRSYHILASSNKQNEINTLLAPITHNLKMNVYNFQGPVING
jgi:hypothetical protein